MQQTTTKWTLKNVITLAIFSIIIFVAMTIAVMAANVLFTPIGGYFAGPGLAALVAAPFYMVLSGKVAKRGIVFILCLITGLVFLSIGQVYTFVTYFIMGLIGETCMWGKGAYLSFKRNMLGFFAYMLALSAGGFMPMLLFRERYLSWYSTVGNEDSMSAMINIYGSAWGILLTVALTAIGTILGCLLGRSIMNRHVKKARI